MAVAAAIALTTAVTPAGAAPANDDFAAAQQLSGNRGFVDVDLAEATAQNNEPQSIGTDERTVWLRYSPTTDGFATFSTCGEDDWQAVSGANLSLFTGSSLGALDLLEDSSGSCPAERPFNAEISRAPVTAGTDYYLQIGSTEAAEVTSTRLFYDFNAAIPANDEFESPSEITGALPLTISEDNGLATIEPDEPDILTYGPRNSTWHKWTPGASGVVSIDTCSSVWTNTEQSIDSTLHVYANANDPADLAGLELQGANDDGCPDPNSLLSHVYVNVSAGTTYWIRLANFGVEHGFDYDLAMRWVGAPETTLPPRIFPEAARLLAGDTYLGHSYDWWADPAVTSTTFQWERCNSAGLECAAIDGATTENYTGQPEDVGHRLRLSVTADNGVTSTTQHSAVTGLVEGPPANDNFADATDLGSAAPAAVADDNYFATNEDGENADANSPADHSVWYRWTAPASKGYVVDSCQSASAPDFAVNVFTGTEVDALTSTSPENVECGTATSGSRTYFTALEGTVYSIQAGSRTGQGPMDFTLSISEVPAPTFATGPSLSGQAKENSTLTLETSAADSPMPVSREIFWTLCDSAGANCTDLADLTDETAELTSEMVGKRIRATVTYTNASGSISESVLSAVIEPLVPPSPPSEPPPPPVTPVDPFPQPTAPKSLGKLKLSKKNTITLTKLSLACGETATGPCTGTITFKTAKVKKGGRTIKSAQQTFKLSVSPGRAMATTFKFSSAIVKAVRAAKSLKTSISIQLGAPGFSSKSLGTGATLSLK